MNLDRDLNPEQRAAVLHGNGPLLILAGAGSGKTRVITYRIAHLIKERGLKPWQLLALTFTNKAAGEMRDRIAALVGEAKDLWALTFHAFGARLLRRHADLLGWGRDFTIYDTDDAKRLGRMVLHELDLDPELHKVVNMLAAVEKAKRKLKTPDQSGLRGAEKAFYGLYQARLRQGNAFDFSDLILQPNRLFERHPDVLARYRGRFLHVLVDEFQDTDRAQYAILRKLCPPGANLGVVGDDDQSIYRWRGAEVGNILRFEQNYPGCLTVKLEQNYRSSGNILDAAAELIARNPERHEKRLWTEADPGAPVKLMIVRDEREEAQGVARAILEAQSNGVELSEVAVFYRVNAQSRSLEEGLRLYGLPYRVVGGVRFFDRAEIRDLLSYLKLIANPRSDVDLLRVLNVPARGLGAKTRERLAELANEDDCCMLQVIVPERLTGLRNTEKGKALAFGKLVRELTAETEGLSAHEIVRLVIDRTGYAQALRKQASLEAEGRLENLQELVSAAEDFARGTEDTSLAGFLEHVALITDIDLAEADAQAVTLMTLHAAKGLEFDQVFLTGMEEGLLPHRRSLEEDERARLDRGSAGQGGVAEERRLCYVGMTRARSELILSCAQSRSIFGRTEINPPSRFLSEVPGLGAAGRPTSVGARRGVVTDLTDVDLDEDDDLDSAEVLIDYSDEYSQLGASAGPANWQGRLVEHASFGRGRVIQQQSSPHGPKLIVEFESVGRKTVLSNYVRIV